MVQIGLARGNYHITIVLLLFIACFEGQNLHHSSHILAETLIYGRDRRDKTGVFTYQYDALIGDGRAGEEAPSFEGGVHVRTCRCTPPQTCVKHLSNGSLVTHKI